MFSFFNERRQRNSNSRFENNVSATEVLYKTTDPQVMRMYENTGRLLRGKKWVIKIVQNPMQILRPPSVLLDKQLVDCGSEVF